MNRRSRKQIVFAMAVLLFSAFVLVTLSRCVTKSTLSSASSASGFPIYINEIMASNESYPDEQGGLYDWIELYNSLDYSVDISNYKLTDNNQKVRYSFPSGSKIEGKGYLVVYCKKMRRLLSRIFQLQKQVGRVSFS